jgi:E3 UFM1-protein ligase 1
MSGTVWDQVHALEAQLAQAQQQEAPKQQILTEDHVVEILLRLVHLNKMQGLIATIDGQAFVTQE